MKAHENAFLGSMQLLAQALTGPKRYQKRASIVAVAVACGHEGHEVGYCERHDAYYCATCDAWLESKCADPTCVFCASRPQKPSQCVEAE